MKTKRAVARKKSGPKPATVGKSEKGGRARFTSPWQVLLEFHTQRNGLGVVEFSERLGLSHAMVSHYFLGRVLPPTGERLEQMVQILHLTEAEAETFREEALLANSPTEVRALVVRLREQLAQQRRET